MFESQLSRIIPVWFESNQENTSILVKSKRRSFIATIIYKYVGRNRGTT